jgi:hypothetical protein
MEQSTTRRRRGSTTASGIRAASISIAILIAFALAPLLLSAATGLAGPPRQPVVVTFDSPAVTDLSGARRWKLPSGQPSIPAAVLAPDAAHEILAARPVTEDSPAQLQNAGAAEAARSEKALLAKEPGSVTRQGKDLVVTPRTGPPLLFRSFSKPATMDAEGDSAHYAYAGRMLKGTLHRVLVDFGHDSPGSFLVSAETGKAAFVHDGGDFVALSPGGERLVLFNDLNPPITFVVASLPEAGAVTEVVCRLGEKGRGTIVLKGWRGADSVDLVLGIGKTDPELIPLRLEKRATGWQLLVPDPRRLALPDAVSCYMGMPGT